MTTKTDDAREGFEAWVLRNAGLNLHFGRNAQGGYYVRETHIAFLAWQAATATARARIEALEAENKALRRVAEAAGRGREKMVCHFG